MIVVIDNYDSFTYNLVQRLGEIDSSVDLRIFRNDEVSIDDLESLCITRLLISPGPCTPSEAGISVECVRHFQGRFPILGVCLGHQSIGQALGGKIIRSPVIMHGKTDFIFHDGRGLFEGISEPFVATRYHSLVIDQESLPSCLTVSAWSRAGSHAQIMGVRHKVHKLEGWQFHPESFLTEPGSELLRRFIAW